jgi:hypothetical protein
LAPQAFPGNFHPQQDGLAPQAFPGNLHAHQDLDNMQHSEGTIRNSMSTTLHRRTPEPEFNVDWNVQLENLNAPNGCTKMQAMNWQGLWFGFYVRKDVPSNRHLSWDGRLIMWIADDEESRRVLQKNQPTNPDDVESLKKTITDMLHLVWDSTVCTGCDTNLTPAADKYCSSCIPFVSTGVCFGSDHDCIICQDNPGNVRKLCPCGQYICLTCWNRYEKQVECPACRQHYPIMRDRFRIEDDYDDPEILYLHQEDRFD